jgi:hypothetical protein
LGVKTTLKRLAVKLELSWHVFNDFDSINFSPETVEVIERRVVRKTNGDSEESRILATVC